MDAMPPEVDPAKDPKLQAQTAVAKAGLQTANRRQESGMDDEPHVDGCMCKPCIKKRDDEQAKKIASVGDVIGKLLIKDAAKVDAERKAADKAARQKAHDAEQRRVKRMELARDNKANKVNDVESRFFKESQAKQEAAFRQGRDIQPSPNAEIGEFTPRQSMSGDPDAATAAHNKAEGKAQRSLVLQPPPRNSVRYADPYSDLSVDGYKKAGKQLMGEDSRPMTSDEKQIAIASADDAFYATVRAQWERA